MSVLVTIRYRSDGPEDIRAWGTGSNFADALYYLARHAFVVDAGEPQYPGEPIVIVMRVYQGAVAERHLAALEPPPPEAPP